MSSLARTLMSLALAVASVALAVPAFAVGNTNVQAILTSEMAAHPGGEIEGSQIVYPDGTIFTAVPAGTESYGQCGSGYFCGWSGTNYTGSFYSTSGSGVTRYLSWYAQSYRNNRANAARLYNSTSSASLCFTPSQDRASVGSSYYSPDKVYLSATTSC